ncbi:hypothetical protein ACIGD1_24755 [Streptomyces sp. NPDC085612]|uniref:hypothetical protein n=1 Tax=Streptomyces sp. NPDC085612 TaxID=3365732 RepID=UPI0037D4147C
MAIPIADIAWVRAELAPRFLELTTLHHPPDPPGVTFITSRMSNRGEQKDSAASAQVVEPRPSSNATPKSLPGSAMTPRT